MALIKHGEVVADRFLDVTGATAIPARGAIVVSLEQWLANLDVLVARTDPLGIRLKRDQHPEVVADDLDHFALIALEVPVFKDGRAFGYARLLREHWGFRGELRAVGDVLPEQVPFMQRIGFDTFELRGWTSAGSGASADRLSWLSQAVSAPDRQEAGVRGQERPAFPG